MTHQKKQTLAGAALARSFVSTIVGRLYRTRRGNALMLLACRVALASTPGRTLASAVQKPAELVGVCTRESSAVVPSASKPATKGHTCPDEP